MVKVSYQTSIPQIWGKGLKDQMVHFDGRATSWYRYESDNAELKDFMVQKSLEDPLFYPEVQKEFKKNIDHLRKIISVEPTEISDNSQYLAQLKETFFKFYPFYPLPIFLAGPWREEFLRNHPQKGQSVIDLLMDSRRYSEGILKENDIFLRKWLEAILVRRKLPASYLKLLSVEEIDALVNEEQLPTSSELEQRAKGYFYMDGLINPISSLSSFLASKNIVLDEIVIDIDMLKGSVACKGGIVQGYARVIMNSEEVIRFNTNEILITPMTSPEYLSAIQKAKAIVTNEGGLSCHAAIIARELGIPTVIGTKQATKIFQDGDFLEVDAEQGIVRRL